MRMRKGRRGREKELVLETMVSKERVIKKIFKKHITIISSFSLLINKTFRPKLFSSLAAIPSTTFSHKPSKEKLKQPIKSRFIIFTLSPDPKKRRKNEIDRGILEDFFARGRAQTDPFILCDNWPISESMHHCPLLVRIVGRDAGYDFGGGW